MDLSTKTDDQLQNALSKAVAAKDAASALIIEQEILKRNEKPVNAVSTNMTEQALTGFYEGVARGAGAPVDIISSGLNKLGLDTGDAPVGGSQSIRNLFQMLSNDSAMTNVAPQTRAQRIVRGGTETLGETIPAAAGILALAPKAAVNAAPTITQAAKNALAQVKTEAVKAPAMFAATDAAASFAGGASEQAVEEILPDNPTAQMIGNILGALGGAKSVSVAERLVKKAPTGPLTSAELKRQAGNLYENQIDEGLSAQPEITETIFENSYNILNRNGLLLPRSDNRIVIDPDYPKLRGAFKLLDAYKDKGMTGANILAIRKGLNSRYQDAKGSEKNALRNLLREFDQQTASIAPNIKVANAMYAKAMKAEQVETLLELARTRSATANMDLENAIRAEFRPLVRRIIDGKEVGWTQDEFQQLRQIVEGGGAENIARFVGKLAPTGVVSLGLGTGVPVALATNISNDPAVLGTVAASTAGLGIAGKATGSQLQKRNVDNLINGILQGRNLTPVGRERARAALATYLSGQAIAQ